MSNNRDDKFEGQDDSEYHFSDEEVSYEVESEESKAPAASAQGGIVSRLKNSRRLVISSVVFLAIVFVVYKVVSPGTSTPVTDISTAPAVASAPPAAMPQQPVAPAVAQTPPAVAPATPPAVAAAPTTTPAVQQPVQAPAAPAVASMPPVIPVQSTVPAGQSPAAAMGAYIEDKSTTLSAASQQAVSQIQAQSTQQFNDFTNQNKAMQSQIQSLSARVADMEAQINQLVQVLTRRNQATAAPTSMNNPPPPPVREARPQVRVAYNVQAIIPGRAWLKSDNGETLTVAEGDVIRDVGRVTKIDPYDGVVEINTGTKAISLSYGG